MANAVSSVDVPLSLFSSLNTELSPPDLAEGVSPANNDVVFTPGAVATRWGMNRTLVVNGDAGPWSYEKSFVLPNGVKKNLYLSKSTGNLYVEDVTNSPGNLTLLWVSAGASYASSITANNSEYIALSDGQHGVDIPLQYDGTNLWRITQDGPGTPPTVTSIGLPSVQMAGSGNTLSRMNNNVTCNTASAHGLQVGYQAQISNVPDSNSTTVNQSRFSSAVANNPTYWGFNSGQYRSNFNPGISPLSAFVVPDFGLNIPSAATILGAIIGFSVSSQAASTSTVNQVALWYGGAQEGTAKSPATSISTSVTPETYGGSSDLWGAALTPSIVNDPSFGFAISINATTSRIFLQGSFTITVFYTLSGSGTVAIISSIVINNEITPGQALITTTQPHGLIPTVNVSIVGVQPSAVGGGISSAQWSAGITTLTMNSSHGLQPGSVVQVAGVTTTTAGTVFSFGGTFTVLSVPSPVQLVYVQTPINASDPDTINGTGGTASITWPVPDSTPTPTYFQVQSCPTPTTFYVSVYYADGTWSSGTVGFIWEGTFFVTEVPTATSFVYQQYGPNGATSAVGTVTPWGQATPGIHQVQQSFLLFNGTITPPSPPAQFIANGGQYLQIDNLAIGPASVKARILQFTGAGGAFFFYIPIPAVVNGIVVSTATQINDNTTTSIILDFSDNTLYGTGSAGAATGTAVSVPGNNLAACNVLGPSAGLFTYGQRLIAWANRNKVNNFLNLGFDGGSSLDNLNRLVPTGWSYSSLDFNGSPVSTRLGFAWQVSFPSTVFTGGNIQQGAYTDYQGTPRLQPNTQYSVRFFAEIAGTQTITPTITVALNAGTFFSSFTVNVVSMQGSFYEGSFVILPDTIPSDLYIRFSFHGQSSDSTGTITIDDIEIFPTQQPFNQNEAWISYAGNFGGFDGLTGLIGPVDDTSPIMNFGTIRKTLYMVTGTGLHETQDDGQSEPSSWDVSQVADNCGAYSIASVARNPQGIGSAGKNWLMWNGPDGVQLFSGQLPYKISQEIQSFWDQIPDDRAYQCWTKNYETRKWCFFGIPLAAGGMTTLVLDYRNLDGEAIAFNPPIHISFTGKMIASDLTRKWTEWKLNAYCGELLYRQGNISPQIALGIQDPTGHAQSYIFNANQFFDDDFGISLLQYASYTTYFFVSHEMEQALQVGSHRKVYTLASAFISGIGTWTMAANAAALGNIVQTSGPWPLQSNPGSDSPFGINLTTTRCAFTITAQPLNGQVYFKLQKMVINMNRDPNMPVGQIGSAF